MTRATQTKTVETIHNDELDLELTKATYQRVMRAIDRSAERVETALEGADEKEVMSLERSLAQHHKVLDNLMKMTGGMNANQQQSNNVTIDLNAARSEILERISRIRAAS